MATETEVYFRQLCESLGFVLVAVDPDLRVQYWNPQAAKQFGRPAEEIAGCCLLDVLPQACQEQARVLFRSTIENKVPGDLEIKFEAGGDRRTFVLVASPIINPRGECVGASASMRDISERKRLSQQLARGRRIAALGNMAGAVAHHFNNILGGMLTSIDYVLPSDSPRELRRTLRLLAQAISRATRITQQLSTFAESETDATELAALDSLVSTFVEQIRPQAVNHGVNLLTNIERVVSCRFEPHRLTLVLHSVVQNAFDAMIAGGTLTISMKQEKDQAVITVEDTGCGIPEESQDRLFEPFFTTKGEFGGGSSANIGLGLAVVHGLVSEMGGTIRVTSKVGQGTLVEVRLPLSHTAGGSAGNVASSEPEASDSGAAPA
jgi:PAS domain S-box-containing protein